MKEAYRLLHNGILAFAKAERQGIRVDLDYVYAKKDELTETIEGLTDEVQNTKFYKHWEHVSKGNVNMNSDVQLANFLYNVKKLKPALTTKTGKGSTNEEALEALDIPELNTMLRIRKLKKLRDTYLEQFLRESVDGYIHPFYNLHTTLTYRSSSDSPNFQNIPVRDEEAKEIIRSCLFPRPGHQILELDYSGIEVRIAACYHKDPTMLKYIKDPTTDMHGDMAQQIFMLNDFEKHDSAHKILRSGAKNGFVFPQFYGDYYGNNAVSLAKWTKLPLNKKWTTDSGILLPSGEPLGAHMKGCGISSMKEFTKHLQVIEKHFWNERFPVYNSWKEEWYNAYRKKGYFDTLTGFRCSGEMGRNNVINYPVQGSAFHCLLWSFTEMDRKLDFHSFDTRQIGQIHDSIILDVNPDEVDVTLEMAKQVTCVDLRKHWPWIITPLEIEAEMSPVDESWFHKEEIKI